MNINSNSINSYVALLNNSAQNIANINNKFSKNEINIASEMTEQISLSLATSAQVKAIHSQDDLIKKILDIKV